VVEGARGSGIGSELLDASVRAVRNWNANHTEIVLQVEEDNPIAIQFYKRRGWEFVFADPTCRRYDTSGIFLRETRVTKYAMVKRLDDEDVGNRDEIEKASNLVGSQFLQRLRSSFFVQ
jgi:ribosomal protein S18 acetylase RimI-like enzyme